MGDVSNDIFNSTLFIIISGDLHSIDTEILEKYKTITHSRHILVVDDDSTTRIILRKMLVKDGWRVAEAEHGKDAIKRINEEKPELILLDLLMPVMDGFELLNVLKDNDELKHKGF